MSYRRIQSVWNSPWSIFSVKQKRAPLTSHLHPQTYPTFIALDDWTPLSSWSDSLLLFPWPSLLTSLSLSPALLISSPKTINTLPSLKIKTNKQTNTQPPLGLPLFSPFLHKQAQQALQKKFLHTFSVLTPPMTSYLISLLHLTLLITPLIFSWPIPKYLIAFSFPSSAIPF